MSNTLNLFDIIKSYQIPTDDVVIIRHTFNKKDTRDIWDKYNRSNFKEYQSIQPSKNFFKNKKYILSFIADGKSHARFVGCYEILDNYEVSKAKRKKDFPLQDYYDEPGNVYFETALSEYMNDMIDRLVIDWPGAIGYVQYSEDALKKKQVVSIHPDSKHVFPGYYRVAWDFQTMQEYVTNEEQYEEIANALKEVFAVYLVVDTKSGKYYVGSAYGKDGLFGRWKTYANTNGKGGASKYDSDGNVGIIEYLKDNSEAYLNFQYSILEIVHKTGNNAKDVEATLEAEKIWKQKLCTLNTVWGLNRN